MYVLALGKVVKQAKFVLSVKRVSPPSGLDSPSEFGYNLFLFLLYSSNISLKIRQIHTHTDTFLCLLLSYVMGSMFCVLLFSCVCPGDHFMVVQNVPHSFLWLVGIYPFSG